MRPGLIFFIGFCATFVLVQYTSKSLRSPAPNFFAACQPENVTSLCNATSSHYVIVNCTTKKSWISASSSYPFVITTMQTFDMFFLVYYIFYRTNSLVKFFVSVSIASIFKLITGCLTLYCNEAFLSAVGTGQLIGISCALLTFMCLRWLEWKKNRKSSTFLERPPSRRKTIDYSTSNTWFAPIRSLGSLPQPSSPLLKMA